MKEHDDAGCECEICKNGMEAYLKKEAELIEKVGWYAHLVGGYPDGRINAHTHNIKERFGHDDLQIVIELPTETINGIFHGVVSKIKDGISFKDGDKVYGIIKELPVGFFLTKDGSRDVLRIILPDVNGVVEKDEMKDGFEVQFEELKNPERP